MRHLDMKPANPTPIKALAQKCARAGLKIDDAVALFTALYIADALALHNGSVSRAAERAGIDRVTLARNNKRARLKGETG